MPMKTQQLLPEVLEMDMRKWFKEAQYGMMAHWGLYSLLGGEWNGKKSSSYAEWIQANQRIPMAEYDKLATAFNPVYFNADQWIRLAKECGMKYFVMTSKHHDGFAMYHSKVDPYNVVDATPFGRDVIAELGEACYKHGLKFGLYYSQDLDWHEKHGGGYKSNAMRNAGLTERHGRALLRLETPAEQREALAYILSRDLNVAATDAYIDRLLEAKAAPESERQKTFILKDVRVFLNTIAHSLDLMKQGGIDAGMQRQETDDALILTINIPKARRREPDAQRGEPVPVG